MNESDSHLKPQASNLAINKLWFNVSKTFDKLVNIHKHNLLCPICSSTFKACTLSNAVCMIISKPVNRFVNFSFMKLSI